MLNLWLNLWINLWRDFSSRWAPRIGIAPLAPLALVAVLAGCAEVQLVSTGVKGAQGALTAPAITGYKVGKPYRVGGTWYYPAEDFSYDETGLASWYGVPFHGQRTANGEVYDKQALTAAHTTLPMPSAVRVTNLDNGRAVVLRVNDRGPFVNGRIIDVSERAAELLGFKGEGVAKVRVQILADESRQIKLAALSGLPGVASPAAELQRGEPVPAVPRVAVTAQALPPIDGPPGAAMPTAPVPTAQVRVAPARVAPVRVASADPAFAAPTSSARFSGAPALPEDVEILPVSPSGIYVQTGAFAKLANALRMRDRVITLGPTQISRVQVSGARIYRVRIGPVGNPGAADAVLADAIDLGLGDARIIVE